jgi:hypothetical protein
LLSFVCAQVLQKVHSKLQMRASADSPGKSRLQHSQLGRSCSIADSKDSGPTRAMRRTGHSADDRHNHVRALRRAAAERFARIGALQHGDAAAAAVH